MTGWAFGTYCRDRRGNRRQLWEMRQMPKISRESAAHVDDFGPAEDRHEDLAGYTTSFTTIRQGADLAPMLKGLPDDRCQCPHWGYEGTHQPMLSGEQRGGGAAGDAELRVDVLHVVARGLRRNHQALSDLLVRVAPGQQPEHLDLACGEPAGPCQPGRRPVARRPQYGVHRLAIEPASDDLGP